MGKRITVALAGNPNSGKTTLFNRITGARQHVGNYPGVTVEKKEGRCVREGIDMNVVDLPGTYSLTAYSVEERVARSFITEEKPDVLVDVIDASNLERNLYLATQLMELDVPLVFAFNMSDAAEARGYEFDLAALSKLLGVPIVPTVGHKGQGVDELLDAVCRTIGDPQSRSHATVHYGDEIEREIAKVQRRIEEDEPGLSRHVNARWAALKLIENDSAILEQVTSSTLKTEVEKSVNHITKVFHDRPEIVMADRRYGFISGACQETVRSTVEARHTRSDQIDAVLANRLLGLPIFLILMYMVFQLTFTIGEIPMGWLESSFAWLGDSIAQFWPKGSESALRSLLVDGVIGGVGGVIVFLPNIMLLFLAIALLEDSGYMARAAFVMDHFMHKFDLHGKSFIPMLIGFGCSVPAIMATRTLENERDRLTTMLVTPLMSCGARLPIYALLIPAFFPPSWRAPILMLIYLIGVLLALVCAKLLRATLLRGESTPFVMELPPYRLPTFRGAMLHMWVRSWSYVRKAGTVILAISIVLWALTTYPKKPHYDEDFAAQGEEAAAAHEAGVKALNPLLGLPTDSDVLLRAMHAEQAMNSADDEYYPHESGYQETIERERAALGELENRQGGAALRAFLDARNAITQVEQDFAELMAAANAAPHSHERLILEHRRDAALAAVKSNNAEAYASALKYVDEVEAPFQQAMERIEQQKRAEELTYSAAGRIGHAIEPLLRPMGFDWRIGTALVGAVAAKEVFVAQLGIVFSMGETDEGSQALRERLRSAYSPLVAFCIMLFCLISAPCVATIATTRSESNSTKWALFQFGALSALAWMITTIVYQVGSLFGLGIL